MISIALTGLPGSGKTYISKILKNHFDDIYKTQIIDSDKIIAEFYENKSFCIKYFNKFSWFQDVFIDNKYIDKKILISKIINNNCILCDLQKILYPILKKKFELLIKESNLNELFIFEIPLLFESNMQNLFNLNILILSNDSIRLKRLENRMNNELYEILIKYHFSNNQKKRFSDLIFYNNCLFENESCIKNIIEKIKNIKIK
jgi:dephospho-CoA kinase